MENIISEIKKWFIIILMPLASLNLLKSTKGLINVVKSNKYHHYPRKDQTL